MHSIHVLSLAATETSATGLLITGFVFVIGVLAVLAIATWLGGKFFAGRNAAPVQPKEDTSDRPTAASVIREKEEVEGRVAAVISAAVHVALQDRRFRVRAIRRASPGWAQEGRRQIFSSHRVR